METEEMNGSWTKRRADVHTTVEAAKRLQVVLKKDNRTGQRTMKRRCSLDIAAVKLLMQLQPLLGNDKEKQAESSARATSARAATHTTRMSPSAGKTVSVKKRPEELQIKNSALRKALNSVTTIDASTAVMLVQIKSWRSWCANDGTICRKGVTNERLGVQSRE